MKYSESGNLAPTQDLVVALAPIDIVRADVTANLMQVAEVAHKAKGADLLVVPEMFSTGYITEPVELHSLAEPRDGKTIQRLADISYENGMAICGSMLVSEGDRMLNSGFMIHPSGEVDFYDKHHLFTPGGEDKVYAAGPAQSGVMTLGSWRVKLAVCYDLRFPVWCRNHRLEYDALIVVANWPSKRMYAWNHLLIARAIENQAYVVGVNRTGADHAGEYLPEMTGAFDHWGKPVSAISNDPVRIVLSAERLGTDRRRFSPWADADDYMIIN